MIKSASFSHIWRSHRMGLRSLAFIFGVFIVHSTFSCSYSISARILSKTRSARLSKILKSRALEASMICTWFSVCQLAAVTPFAPFWLDDVFLSANHRRIMVWEETSGFQLALISWKYRRNFPTIYKYFCVVLYWSQNVRDLTAKDICCKRFGIHWECFWMYFSVSKCISQKNAQRKFR